MFSCEFQVLAITFAECRRLCRRHAASATPPTNSNSTVPGSGTAAGLPDTGAATGTDVCTAGLEACSATLLSTLLTAGTLANEID